MAPPNSAFDWDDLLTCIEERQVIPIVGRELMVLQDANREVLLDHYLGRRLADRLHVELESLGGRRPPSRRRR